MGLLEKIDAAIAAHGMWKVRLSDAIKKGASDFKPETVKTDNNCDFGKWLYNEVDAETKANPVYEKIRKMHADFHLEAGRVLALAVGGRKDEAAKAIDVGSTFTSLSVALTKEMIAWKKTLKA